MKYAFLLVVMVGCDPRIPRNPSFDAPIITAAANDYFVDVTTPRETKILLLAENISLKELRARVRLLTTPNTEILADERPTLPFSVTRINKTAVVVKPKTSLIEGLRYGIYVENPLTKERELIYTFVARKKSPSLISHDLDDVSMDRSIFIFEFDAPIYLHGDSAIALRSIAHKKPVDIEEISVDDTRKSIIVKIKKSEKPLFLAGERYAFIFGHDLKDAFAKSVNLAPLSFIIKNSDGKLKETTSPTLRLSAESVEINWVLNQSHITRISIMPTREIVTKANDDALHKNHKSFTHTFLPNESQLYVGDLKSQSLYRFIVFKESKNQERLIAHGEFTTAAPESLKISEIMTAPVKTHAHGDGEFIELVNTSDEDLLFNDLYLTIVDHETTKINTCVIASSSSPLTIKKRGYILVVSENFSEEQYALDDHVAIRRLPQKTLCGGLSNTRQQTIKIERNKGRIVDRYGGHLPHVKRGQSIARIDLMGLDESENYCYSSNRMPTPGKPNGRCGDREFLRNNYGRT